MNILAIETSTEACSAALSVNGEIQEKFEIAPRGHGDLILNMVEQLLAEAGLKPPQLSAVGFGRGPGAFTGVRIATSVVQGIAFALDLPVAPVSTLATLAQGAYRQSGHTALLCTMDARMGEVYWAAYRVTEQGLLAVADEMVCLPANTLLVEGSDWQGIGSGWQVYESELSERYAGQCVVCDAAALPRAYDTAVLAQQMVARGAVVSAEQALPVYLRDKVV